MTIERMIELLDIEHECMLRNSHDACDSHCGDCDLVQDDGELHEMYIDVIALLKTQKPHVLTLEEIRDALKRPVWKETKSAHKDLYTGWVIAYDIQTGQGITGERLGMSEPSGRVVWYRLDDYGKTWRCWTSRPTDEQREATPWEQ